MLYSLVNYIFSAVYLILMIRVLLSWIPHNPTHPLVEKIYQVSEPLLRPFRNIIPAHQIGFDLSPIFAFIIIGLVKRIILDILIKF